VNHAILGGFHDPCQDHLILLIKDEAHILSIYLYNLLLWRSQRKTNDYVFPGSGAAGYIVTDVDRLRKPIQQITDYFLKCMGVEPSATILTIQPKQGAVCE